MRLSKYGLSYEQYKNMHERQDYLCAICQHKCHEDDLHVDHDHDTGQVRGLLCSSCNTGLGMFKDKIRCLASAIVYLENNGKGWT